MQINFIKLNDQMITPTRVDDGSAGWDLYVPYNHSITIKPGERTLVKLGFATEFILPQKKLPPSNFIDGLLRMYMSKHLVSNIPDGYQIEIRPRSGNALKKGLTVLNSPGTIDSSYRHEWGVLLYNASEEGVFIQGGDRIAQAVLMPFWSQEWTEVSELSKTDRLGGFGSSGGTVK